MADPEKLEAQFWKLLKSERTIMLGLADANESGSRPMTVHFDGDKGPLWIFTSTESRMVGDAGAPGPAIATFTAKGHDLFASIQGTLSVDHDRATLDRLWNPYVAAWYEEGKTDPKLVLLRFDPVEARIWENASSIVAGVRRLLGSDPKVDYRDKVADVDLT